MHTALRTARPRHVAVLVALGLAATGAIIAGCVLLHSRAETLRRTQIDLLHLCGQIVVMEKLPATVRDRKTLAAVLGEISGDSAANQAELARLARIDERDDLGAAAVLDRRNVGFLMTEATLMAQGRQADADALAARYRRSLDAEWDHLTTAEADLGRHQQRAEAIANDAASIAVIAGALACSLLFWRLARANARAGAARALAEGLVESSVDGIFAFDRDLRYHTWNRALEQATGIGRGQVLGRSLGTAVSALEPALAQAGRDALAGRRTELHDVELPLPGLRGRTFDLSFAPLLDERGAVDGGLGHVRDVTRRNELELRLRQSQTLEAIGRLAGGIAHDFNNLLMGVGGRASLALSRPAGDPAVREDLERIGQAAARGAGLTEQLLFFARQGERPPGPVELNAVVRDSVELLRRVDEPRVAIELDLEDPSWVVGDAGRLEQVVLSLGSNAYDAMPDGGVLRLRTRPLGAGRVELVVADTGCGIPEADRPRVFEPFFTTKPVGSGAGLGLASAYGIVTQADGTIELESEVGRGTTFTITLPASPAPGEAPAGEGPAPPARPSARILLVEDEDVVREVIAAGLERQGYAVEAAALPADALAYVAGGGGFDLLVTDVVMPGMSGAELVERLRESAGGAFGAVYMSGYAATGFTLDERSAFLQKPFELPELYAAVERLLAADA